MSFILWVAVILVALVIVLWFFPVALWFQALLSGVYVSLIQLILMRWRGVNPKTIVYALITGTKAGLTLHANELEAHYLAGGRVTNVVNALVSAERILTWTRRKKNVPPHFRFNKQTTRFSCRLFFSWLEKNSKLRRS